PGCAVNRGAFFVAGDEEREGAPAFACAVGERGGEEGGDAALHVDRAAAVKEAIGDVARERTVRPALLVARRHYVGMPGEGEVRGASADGREKVLDIGRARGVERHA